ncbi:hypothetical protein [Adlercreutzia murintestinalis]|jgi:hypothetical protein|uniref:hypothetical protein n=1 Tax=Adlercreutzia murintestinalis TaxID=2941325 RepID=UPI00203FA7AF|nr:hypothetical protein [Adlercreutzia murintestinalis]
MKELKSGFALREAIALLLVMGTLLIGIYLSLPSEENDENREPFAVLFENMQGDTVDVYRSKNDRVSFEGAFRISVVESALYDHAKDAGIAAEDISLPAPPNHESDYMFLICSIELENIDAHALDNTIIENPFLFDDIVSLDANIGDVWYFDGPTESAGPKDGLRFSLDSGQRRIFNIGWYVPAEMYSPALRIKSVILDGERGDARMLLTADDRRSC